MLTHFVSNSVILYFPCCFIGFEHSEMSTGLFYCINEGSMGMSGWFISLPQFLPHCNRDLEQWTKRCRTTDKLQLNSAQADRFFISLTLPKKSSSSFLSSPLGFPLLYFQSPPFGYTWFKVRLLLTTSQWKWIQMGICSRLIDSYKLYNSRLHCLYFPKRLPIIPSVIIRCRIFMSP